MNSFLEDIEFASKVNEAIKRAEQRGIDNSLELTKEMIKQQYGDIEKLKKALLDIKEYIEEMASYIDRFDSNKRKYCDYGDDLSPQHIIDIVNKALGDKEND